MAFRDHRNIADKYLWTTHARMKMGHYRLTESRIKRVMRHPARIEEGVLESGIAAMQPAEGKNYSEIWVMYVLAREGGSLGNMFSRHARSAPAAELANSRAKFPGAPGPSKLRSQLSQKHISSTAPRLAGGQKRIKIITAWRYPGKSPTRDPIPQTILREVRGILFS